MQDPTSPPEMEEYSPTLPKLTTLKAILSEVSCPPQVWPEEALRAILKRHESVQKKKWDLKYAAYIEKFGNKASIKELNDLLKWP